MGQKIEFFPEDWDEEEENSSDKKKSNSSVSVEIDNNFSVLAWDDDILSFNEDPFSGDQEQEPLDQVSEDLFEEFHAEDDNSENKKKKIVISHRDTGNPVSQQEEEAFRRQIEDLFELLELEKKSDKSQGVRVYQTDSSPSRPWRFH